MLHSKQIERIHNIDILLLLNSRTVITKEKKNKVYKYIKVRDLSLLEEMYIFRLEKKELWLSDRLE